MIFLHVHLHIMCYHYFKFHLKPLSGLGAVVLTRCNGQMDRQTDGQGDSYIPPQLCLRGVQQVPMFCAFEHNLCLWVETMRNPTNTTVSNMNGVW